MRRLVFVAIPLAFLAAAPRASADTPGAARVSYRPPVDAPVAEKFRKPEHKWKAGNRGIDYAVVPGTPVRAAADGEVTFSGQVGGTLHVVVLHADGLRTSYSFLESTSVNRGDRVQQGHIVGTSGPTLHFGARQPDDTYIDPETLFDGPPEVHLVPEVARQPPSEAHERAGITRLLAALGRGSARATVAGVGWAARHAMPVASAAVQVPATQVGARLDELRGLVHYATSLSGSFEALRLAGAVKAWVEQRRNCTPESIPAPRLTSRRLAVLVGGLGSASGHASVLDIPTARLGYATGDVLQFSYRGDTAAERAYTPDDTEQDLRRPARRLRVLLERLSREHPGVPIDVIAHSQGGLVARAALGDELDRGDPRIPSLGAVVTLATPHQGADMATAAGMLSHPFAGRFALGGVHRAAPAAPDPSSASVRQLSETSGFLRSLNRRPVPPGARFTSIGARGDLVVPAPRARLAGAANVTVSVPGATTDHAEITRSPQAEREIALAVAGLPPTCQGFGDALSDVVVGSSIGRAEDTIGAALWAGARVATPLPFPGGTP